MNLATHSCRSPAARILWDFNFLRELATDPLDCLQSTFSPKICLVLDLIQRDCKPRCALACLGFACSAVTLQRKIRDCSKSTDLLGGFSIGRYEEKRYFFDLFATKFESGAMRFLGEKSLRR